MYYGWYCSDFPMIFKFVFQLQTLPSGKILNNFKIVSNLNYSNWRPKPTQAAYFYPILILQQWQHIFYFRCTSPKTPSKPICCKC